MVFHFEAPPPPPPSRRRRQPRQPGHQRTEAGFVQKNPSGSYATSLPVGFPIPGQSGEGFHVEIVSPADAFVHPLRGAGVVGRFFGITSEKVHYNYYMDIST